MNKRIYWLFTLFTAICLNMTAQNSRFQSEIYATVDTIGDIQYGESINLKGEKQTLLPSILLGVDKKPVVKWFQNDKLHLNEEGYKVWSKVVKKY
jgi:lysophospholipase L1-like esterase